MEIFTPETLICGKILCYQLLPKESDVLFPESWSSILIKYFTSPLSFFLELTSLNNSDNTKPKKTTTCRRLFPCCFRQL
eukprot:g72025.t1